MAHLVIFLLKALVWTGVPVAEEKVELERIMKIVRQSMQK
jgi:hypothetical protein